MAYAMTKQGSLDNCITYEFICDTIADMNTIENRYRTIGSIAIVLQGESDGLEVYIAGSNHSWNPLSTVSSSDTVSGLSIYLCGQNEVENGLPNVDEPDDITIYLVPASEESNNLYEEYIWVDNSWEKFGGTSIDLSNYATLSDISGFYTKPNGGIPAADLAETYLTQHQDVSGFAPKSNPVFTGSISMGRRANISMGTNSVATGNDVQAYGNYSHAEGVSAQANNIAAHAEGNGTSANGEASHAEGYTTIASGNISHAEGLSTIASSSYSHAEGYSTHASEQGSHAEGSETTASGYYSHAEGSGNTSNTITVGSNTYTGTGAYGSSSHAEGQNTWAIGKFSHAEGYGTLASQSGAHAEGYNTVASGEYSHAEGYGGTYTEDNTTKHYGAFYMSDHSEGYHTIAGIEGGGGQPGNHAEGYQTKATGGAAHSEGNSTVASGSMSHAEGASTVASGSMSHAEGASCYANGNMSHAEGASTVANGAYSHVSGVYNVSDSYSYWPDWTANTSYIVGSKVRRATTTNGKTTYKGYICKTANSDASFTASKWTEDDRINYAVIVGNGTSNNAHSNAYALDWDGSGYFKGDVYIGCGHNSTGGTAIGAQLTALAAQIPTVPTNVSAFTNDAGYLTSHQDLTGYATETFVTTRVPTPPVADGNYILKVNISSGTATYSWVALSDLSGVTF